MWYTLSLGTLSSAAFNIGRGTMKGCFAQLGCGAQAHNKAQKGRKKKVTHIRVERDAHP